MKPFGCLVLHGRGGLAGKAAVAETPPGGERELIGAVIAVACVLGIVVARFAQAKREPDAP